jgi:tetratricopeptide (TPR) repeat protein
MATRTLSAWRSAYKIEIAAILVLLFGLTPYPVELVATMRRATDRRAAGEYAAALDAYRWAARLAPSWPLPWEARGEVFLSQGRFAEAAAALRQAELLGAGHEVTLAIGESLAAQGDWAGALGFWLRAQAMVPGEPAIYLALARGSVAQGSFDQAQAYLRAALSLDLSPD